MISLPKPVIAQPSGAITYYDGFSAVWRGCHTDHYQVGRTAKVLAMVVHAMDGYLTGTRTWFNTPAAKRAPAGSRSSAHFGVGSEGLVDQYVRFADTAYHAGVIQSPVNSRAMGANPPNPNSYTVGIECEDLRKGTDYVFSPVQTHAVAWIIAVTALRHGWGEVRESHVIFHREINSVVRPNCPPRNAVSRAELVLLANQYLVRMSTLNQK